LLAIVVGVLVAGVGGCENMAIMVGVLLAWIGCWKNGGGWG
jgi:hypothetical protein